MFSNRFWLFLTKKQHFKCIYLQSLDPFTALSSSSISEFSEILFWAYKIDFWKLLVKDLIDSMILFYIGWLVVPRFFRKYAWLSWYIQNRLNWSLLWIRVVEWFLRPKIERWFRNSSPHCQPWWSIHNMLSMWCLPVFHREKCEWTRRVLDQESAVQHTALACKWS